MRRADLPRLLERPWHLLAAAIALYWLTALVIGLRADVELGARELVNVALLGPLSLALAYRIGERIAGAALGAWTLLVWIALPWLAPLFTLSAYDATLRDSVLPLVVGLTPDVGYPEGVGRCSLPSRSCSSAGASRSRAAAGPPRRARRQSGSSRLRRPSTCRWTRSRRTWPGCASTSGATACCSGSRSPASSPSRAARLAQRSRSALARRLRHLPSRPGGDRDVEDGELFRALLPALPAYGLLFASLPLLVPTLAARLGPLARPA